MDSTITYQLIDYINKIFDSLDAVRNEVSIWIKIGLAIAAGGTYIYVFRKFASKIVSGEAINITDVAYPIFIAIVLSLYIPICKGLDSLSNLNSEGSTSITQVWITTLTKQDKNYSLAQKASEEKAQQKVMSDAETNLGNEFKKENESGNSGSVSMSNQEPSWYDKMKTVANLISNPASTADTVMKTVMMSFLNIVSIAALLCIHIIAKLYLLFLFIFGPISISFSLIPAFENSIANWFQKYITYSLWLPIANTVSKVFINLIAEVDLSTSGNAIDNMSGQQVSTTIYLILAILSVASFIIVPKIANNILAVGGNQSSTKQMVTQAAMKIASKGAA